MTSTAHQSAVPPAPVPYWHGFNWEPLPFAEWTVWEEFGEDGILSKSLNETIREQREKLNKLGTRYIPYLLGLRNNIKRLIDERLSVPHQRVFRIHFERLVKEIESRIVELETRKDLVEFEANIQPYILAHAAVNTERRADDPMPTDRLFRRVLTLVDQDKPPQLVAARSGGGGGGVFKPEDLVRDMISRLWLPHQAPARKTTTAQDVCNGCNVPMTKSFRDQMLVCPKCGFSMNYLDSTEAARTYGDDVEFTVNASHRYNHWQEYVTRSQGKELKAVPRQILIKIVTDLNKNEGIERAEDITMEHLVRTTSRLILRDYKKNLVQIYCRLTGKWPLQLTTEQMYMCKGMFFEILNAFESLFGNNQDVADGAASGGGGAGGAGAGAGSGGGISVSVSSSSIPPCAITVSGLFKQHQQYVSAHSQPAISPKWFRNKYLMRVICATLGFVWCPPGEELDDSQEEGNNYHMAGDQHSIQRMKTIFAHLGWTYPEEILADAMGKCTDEAQE